MRMIRCKTKHPVAERKGVFYFYRNRRGIKSSCLRYRNYSILTLFCLAQCWVDTQYSKNSEDDRRTSTQRDESHTHCDYCTYTRYYGENQRPFVCCCHSCSKYTKNLLNNVGGTAGVTMYCITPKLP